MADPLSVAASTAGLVSLGLQVGSGITQYLDAVKCRAEELESARQYVRTLQGVLQIIDNYSPRLQAQQPPSLTAVGACLQSSEAELKALAAHVTKLSGGTTANPNFLERAKETKRKLTYPFNRTKVLQLEEKLSRTVGLLQLAVQGLGV